MTIETADLAKAYEGSYYTILGTDQPEQWVAGLTALLVERGIGEPVAWFVTTGGDVNDFARTKGNLINPFQSVLTILMFPLDGMDGMRLAMLKLMAGDRWFDDLVDNMVDRAESDEDEGGQL